MAPEPVRGGQRYCSLESAGQLASPWGAGPTLKLPPLREAGSSFRETEI